MLKQAYRKTYHAILLAKIGGLMAFLTEIKRQFYSKATYVGLEKTLVTNGVEVPCQLEYTLHPASEQDMEEVLRKAKSESKESVHELIQRKWFYESGFHSCYLARIRDNGEICYMAWLISPANSDDTTLQHFSSKLPQLKEEDVLLENSYTLEKYRGNRIMPSAMTRLAELARSNGFKRMITYVRQDNIASLKGCERAGFKQFEEIPELKLLFFTRRKHRLGNHSEHVVG